MAQVYPRVDGGTGLATSSGYPIRGLSPRGRGNHPPVEGTRVVFGSIPAWTGEPR